MALGEHFSVAIIGDDSKRVYAFGDDSKQQLHTSSPPHPVAAYTDMPTELQPPLNFRRVPHRTEVVTGTDFTLVKIKA